ncbi:MAG: D-glycero-D-manno-heptose 1,7-bisphosphate phosphatase [Chlamydiales bacterium]
MTESPAAGDRGALVAGRPAVFLDRDGTIVREVDFLRRPEEVELIPGAAGALRELARAGFVLVVVTNQSGVARGYLDEACLEQIHARMRELLVAQGAHVDLILHCPHHPTAGEAPYRRDCECRKPSPGMLEQAASQLQLDVRASWTVGDSERDLEAGRQLGIPGILVDTGKGASEHARLLAAGRPPAHHVPDLAAAAAHIVEQLAGQGK